MRFENLFILGLAMLLIGSSEVLFAATVSEDCVGEGGELFPDSSYIPYTMCCEGLSTIDKTVRLPDGSCWSHNTKICTSKCGDNTCADYESLCNCPVDCVCKDSDGGKNYYVAGKTYYLDVDKFNTATDFCDSQGILHEYSCGADESVVLEKVACENGCRANACVIDASSPNYRGYYGEYFNLPYDHSDVEDGAYNLEGHTPYDVDWYDQEYLSFSRIDPRLDFGEGFFPVDDGFEGDPYYSAVHWSGKFHIAQLDDYPLYLKSDDDAWIYIDGELKVNMAGCHSAMEARLPVVLDEGEHTIDIYYAERHTSYSYLDFHWLDGEIIVTPLERTEEYCGDAVCQVSLGETSANCLVDCYCGDNICDRYELVGGTCVLDCDLSEQESLHVGNCVYDGDNSISCETNCGSVNFMDIFHRGDGLNHNSSLCFVDSKFGLGNLTLVGGKVTCEPGSAVVNGDAYYALSELSGNYSTWSLALVCDDPGATEVLLPGSIRHISDKQQSDVGCTLCSDQTSCGQLNAQGLECTCVDVTGNGCAELCRLTKTSGENRKDLYTLTEFIDRLVDWIVNSTAE